ncbi:hypothetical protein [Actinokineospora globicatena]|uniref:Uncharacterized protein n=1 Tax=Actinokineospora globicatena TaxID=103729 RepID=A0A9W6QII2_9PSEU|nr:hypothetical protein [Actinokineospora globicatena]GLW91711.1 hypothetical protein Aglo03_25270 [Actinokineospora globicatena]
MTAPSRWYTGSWLPHGLLAGLIVIWVALAATVSAANSRQLTIDVSCSSGNPPVGVWVESSTGGSWWADPGEPGTGVARRYVFQQEFSGPYRVNVGCGGTAGAWGISVSSVDAAQPFRRLVCEDRRTTGGRCEDQPAG